jgi:hypothetical protein
MTLAPKCLDLRVNAARENLMGKIPLLWSAIERTPGVLRR